MLFYACRYRQLSVANWLLGQDADVNMQLKAEPHRYSDTIFYQIKTNSIKQIIQQHQRNLHDEKLIAVHVCADADDSNVPITKVQLHCGATFDHLLKALSVTLRQNRIYFSIARRPVFFRDQTNGLLEFICLFKTDIYHGSNKL